MWKRSRKIIILKLVIDLLNRSDIMLKSIKIKNFRSLKNFNMEFNSGLNVIIGENDAGKTSLIDSLKILFSKKKIE